MKHDLDCFWSKAHSDSEYMEECTCNHPHTNSHILHPECKYCFCHSKVEGIIGSEKRGGDIETPECGVPGCKIDNGVTGHHIHNFPHTCSPDKALMRVVEKTKEEKLPDGWMQDKTREYIQTICGCGKVLSSNEIKE